MFVRNLTCPLLLTRAIFVAAYGSGDDGSGVAGGPSIGTFVGPNLAPFIQDNGIATVQGV